MSSCIACGYGLHYPLYHPVDQPLAALNLPRTQQEALNAKRFPMNFCACARCGHVYNVDFDYSKVPYSTDSNLMYNSGSGWLSYMQNLIERLHKKYNFSDKMVVEIGCGNGHFLTSLHEHIPSVHCIGFEPGIDPLTITDKKLDIRNDYFNAERDLSELKPDILVCRHVIEHLDAPRDFIANISYWCNMHDIYPYFLVEVPRINIALADARINDYLYEHVSNFTDASFRLMFEQADYEILEFESVYSDEVLVALARPKKLPELKQIKEKAARCHQGILLQHDDVQHVLKTLRKQGKSIAFWGGTGKGAAFLNAFNITYDDYPLVIDSDVHKVGRFVPGMGQEILSPEYLLAHPADIIVITTQWRAADIFEEIKQRGIACEAVYIVQRGTLALFSPQE